MSAPIPQIIDTNIIGLKIVKGKLFSDNRGQLLKPYSTEYFDDNNGLNANVRETWFTRSHKNVIRGMHLQIGQYACEKWISVVQGRIIDVVVDLRKKSESFMQYFEIELNENNPVTLFVPQGCAHGYRVLEDKSITMYMATNIHDPLGDVGIKWDSFGYDWEIDNPIISFKDASLPELNAFVDLI